MRVWRKTLGWLVAAVLVAAALGPMQAAAQDQAPPAPAPAAPAETPACTDPDAGGPGCVQLQLLAINDLHGQLIAGKKVSNRDVGNAAVLAAYLKQREQQVANSLLIGGGDLIGASPPVSALLQDEPTIDFLNAIGMDLSVVGNHEFDEGFMELFRLVNGGCHGTTGCYAGADFPVLAANVVYEFNNQPILPPYWVFDVDGVQVGFVGVVTRETPTIVTPTGIEGLKFLDPATAANQWVQVLKDQGVAAIVVIAHLGGFKSEGAVSGEIMDFARALDNEVDVIISGHTHSLLHDNLFGKVVVQAYSASTAFADVDLVLDRAGGDVVKAIPNVITTYADEITADPEIQAMVGQVEAAVAPLVNRVVGTAKAPITREQNAAGESALGNLIADAQRWKMGTQFAFMNPGGIRADMEAGEVTWGELYGIQPFNNDMIKMELTGEQVYTLLNQQWQETRFRILQISGLTYTWDESKPRGEKVIEVRGPDGKPIDRAATYTIACNSFIAAGGDGFVVLKEGKNRWQGVVDLDALVDYIKQLPADFTAEIEGRITRLN